MDKEETCYSRSTSWFKRGWSGDSRRCREEIGRLPNWNCVPNMGFEGPFIVGGGGGEGPRIRGGKANRRLSRRSDSEGWVGSRRGGDRRRGRIKKRKRRRFVAMLAEEASRTSLVRSGGREECHPRRRRKEKTGALALMAQVVGIFLELKTFF